MLFLVFLMGKSLLAVFTHNILLNIAIVGIFAFGVAFLLSQLFLLKKNYVWIDTLDNRQYNISGMKKPKILDPLYTVFQKQNTLDQFTFKSVLSSIEQRLEDQREFNRYIIGLCIFLGLVGTFWGLSKTITAIATVINGIDINASDIKDAFENLKKGLQEPLNGMGYAFSSSLFGLSTSLILGFIDMHISNSFSKFHNYVEEKISSKIQDSSANTKSFNGPAYSEAMLEQLCENLNTFHQHLERTEENRSQIATFLQSFLANLARIDDALHKNIQHMEMVSHRHLELQQQVSQILQKQTNDKSSQSIRSMELLLQSILNELSKTNKTATEEIKKEIRVVSKTLSSLASS